MAPTSLFFPLFLNLYDLFFFYQKDKNGCFFVFHKVENILAELMILFHKWTSCTWLHIRSHLVQGLHCSQQVSSFYSLTKPGFIKA